MITDKKPFCVVPFTTAFTTSRASVFRDCCSKKHTTQILSSPDQSFEDWWNSDKLNDFRNEFNVDSWEELNPTISNDCNVCKLRESTSDNSFRLAVNKVVSDKIDYQWPSSWNISFGNLCNLACWSCAEQSSSVILQHKRKAGIPLSINFDPAEDFENSWPILKENILRSYKHHKIVTLTILGGEPLYNPVVIDFLNQLIDLKLNLRTRLEFHTNGTVRPDRILPIGKRIWNHVMIFVSIDAIGKYAEWLRYGGKWSTIDQNIDQLCSVANYLELHCVLSVLNINQLPDLSQYANEKNINLSIAPVSAPAFMALESWDLPVEKLLFNRHPGEKFQTYYKLIGTNPITGSSQQLIDYINSFKSVRKPLKDFDPEFALLTGW